MATNHNMRNDSLCRVEWRRKTQEKTNRQLLISVNMKLCVAFICIICHRLSAPIPLSHSHSHSRLWRVWSSRTTSTSLRHPLDVQLSFESFSPEPTNVWLSFEMKIEMKKNHVRIGAHTQTDSIQLVSVPLVRIDCTCAHQSVCGGRMCVRTFLHVSTIRKRKHVFYAICFLLVPRNCVASFRCLPCRPSAAQHLIAYYLFTLQFVLEIYQIEIEVVYGF